MKQLILKLKSIKDRAYRRSSRSKNKKIKVQTATRTTKLVKSNSIISKNDYPKRSWLDVPPENKFYVNNGQVLSNLSDLPSALKAMNSETFNHHVSKENNDFANWVDQVMGEKKLAADLRKINSSGSMIKVLQKLL